MKSDLLKGGAWLLIGRILSIIFSFVFSALVVRVLNKEDAGLFFLWMSWISFAVIVSQLGLKTQVVRLIAGNTSNLFAIARHVTFKVFLLSVLMITVVLTVFWISNEQLKLFYAPSGNLYFLVCLWLITTTFISFAAEVFRGLGDYKVVALLEGETSLFVYLGSSFILFVYYIGRGGTLEGVVLALVLSGGGLLLLFLPLLFSGKEGVVEKVSLKEMILYSYPLYFHFMLLAILSKAAFWILGVQGFEKELVYYGVALIFSNAIIFPLVVINALLPSFIVRLQKESDSRQLQSLLANSATFAFLVSFFIGVLLFVFGGNVLEFIYGEDFRAALPILKILIVGQLINVFSGASGLLLSLAGQQKPLLLSTIWSTMLLVFLAWVLVPVFGAEGAALATCTGIIIQNIMMVYFAKQRLGVSTCASLKHMQDILKVLRGSNAFKRY